MTSSTEGKGSMTESEAEALKKKSLSKYGPFNQSIHASRGNDSDEEYGIVVPEEGDDDVKFNKKSLSKFASHSVDPTVTKKSEDDDDYGAFDPTFKLEKVAHTAKGELVVVPENTTPKTIKKTLSKYGTPSSVQKTPASVRSADSDDDYGALESNGQPKKIKKTLSKYSPKNSTNKLEGKLSFEEIKVDSDEEYGELDPNFKPVPVAVTSSGHFVVPPEPTSEKKIKKTLSKYRDSSMSAEKPVTVSSTAGVDVLKSRDSDEEYGNDIDTSYLDSAKAKSRKTVHQNSSASKSHSISQSHSISISKSRSDDTTFSNGEVSTEHLAPVKALVAKIEKNKGGAGVTNKDLAAVEQKENPNNLNVPSTDSLDMSLNALKVQELSRSSSHNNSFIQVEQSSEVKGQSTELSYEDQLISLISKGYTRDQAEEFIHMTKTAKTKKASASRSQSFENSFPQNAMSSTSSMNSASQAPFSSVTAPKRVPSSGLYPSPAYPSQYPSQLYAPTQGQRQTGIDGLVARGYTLEQATAIYESTLLFRSPSGDQGAPTQYYPVYYPPGYYVASPTHGIMQPEQPSLPLNTPPPPPPPHFNPYMPNSPFNNVHDDDEKALKIAILISEQEAEFGVNMYQVVTKKDEMEVQALLNRGFTVDEAILWIFEKRGYCSNKSIADNKSDTVNQGSNGDEISASTLTHSFISESPGEGRRRQKSKSDLDTSQEHKSNDDIRSRSKESEVGVSPADKKMSQERPKPGKKLRSIFSFGGSGASSKTNSNVNSPANSRVNSGDNTGSATKNQHHHKTPEEKEIQKVLKYKDKDVKVITELGFSREQAVQALVENDHNVTMATNYLISSLNDLDVASRNRERRINRSQSDGSHNSHNSSYNSLPVPMIAPGPYAPYPMMYYAPYPGTIPSSLAPSFDNQIMMYPPPPNNSYSVPASHSGSFYQQSLYQQGVSATNSPANLLRTGSTTGIANASHSNHSSFYDVDPNERVLYNRALSSSNDSFQSDPRKKKSGSSNSANNTPSASFYNSRNGTIQQLPPTHMSR